MAHAEITMRSGAVVRFDCTSVEWVKRKNALGDVVQQGLNWEVPKDAKRRPVRIDVTEIVAVIFVEEER